MLVFCLAYSSILKMEAICYSERSVERQRIRRNYVPEDRTLLRQQYFPGNNTREHGTVSVDTVLSVSLDDSMRLSVSTRDSSPLA
jgi:hypothetical protein